MPTIDYRICDRFTDPAGLTESHHSESLARLPSVQWCYRPPVTLPPLQELPLARTGCLTLGSFNNPNKLNERVIELWAAVLRVIPDSRLIIFSVRNSLLHDRLMGFFNDAGVESSRVRIEGWKSLDDYFAAYGEVDIALDPFPYNGATTTLDALLMGVPVVTLAGNHSIARGGTSLLSNLGLEECIATTSEEYVEIIAGLARAPERLGMLRASLRKRVEFSPMMNVPRFTDDLERLYREMWRRWCDGRPIEAINLDHIG